MAEGYWSCHLALGNFEFTWNSGYKGEDYRFYDGYEEAQKKLFIDLKEGSHWKDVELSTKHHDLLRSWTYENMGNNFPGYHRKVCYADPSGVPGVDDFVSLCFFSTFSADRTVWT